MGDFTMGSKKEPHLIIWRQIIFLLLIFFLFQACAIPLVSIDRDKSVTEYSWHMQPYNGLLNGYNTSIHIYSPLSGTDKDTIFVIVPGAIVDKTKWYEFISYPIQHGFQVAFVYPPGNGTTSCGDSIDIQYYEGWIAKLVQADIFQDKTIILIGSSMSGIPIMLQFVKHPEMFDSLIMMNIAGLDELVHPLVALMMQNSYSWRKAGKLVANMSESMDFFQYTPDQTLYHNQEVMRYAFRGNRLIKDLVITEDMIIAVPPSEREKVLLLWGRNDSFFKDTNKKKLKNYFSTEYVDSGHYINQDQPEQAYEKIFNFLKNRQQKIVVSQN
jgi:pimeloyl-ACP methyl ester carboxylesterase